MHSAVLSLGTNIGNRLANLSNALKLLEQLPGKVLRISSIYETAPWGNTNQASFYNQVLEIETAVSAEMLMEKILFIEKEMGRTRTKKWEPRIIDIDILFFNDEIFNKENLHIPHQHLHERRFILEPLNEILPDLVHPVLKTKIHHLLAGLKDVSDVKKLKPVTQQ